MDQGGTGRQTKHRLTVAQAAEALGLTVDAVRSRIKRGTIQVEHEGGRVFVLVDSDQASTGRAQQTDQGSDLTDELRDRLRYVEGQLQAERQAHAEARRIIAGLVERIPALEAPTDAREGPEQAPDVPDRGDVPADRPAASSSSRPWWRRWLGG